MEFITLEQVYYLGVLLVAIAAVLSLVYIGIQIKRYTQVVRLNNAHNVTQELRALYVLMAQDEGLADIFRKGMHDIENISIADKFRFTLIVHNFFRLYEDAYYQRTEGTLEPRYWHGITEQFLFLKDLSGFQTFWRDRKFLFSNDFCNYYDKQVIPAQAHTRFDYQ